MDYNPHIFLKFTRILKMAIPGYAKDFNFPVEVADGRRLTISWNRGEDTADVAASGFFGLDERLQEA